VPVIAAVSLVGPGVRSMGWGASSVRRRLASWRGRVPWYGVVATSLRHHVAAILSAFALQIVPARSDPRVDSAATCWRRAICFSLNVFIPRPSFRCATVSRSPTSYGLAGGAYLSCWLSRRWRGLMAQTYATTGWWAAVLLPCRCSATGPPIGPSWKCARCSPKPVASLAEGGSTKRDKFTGGHSQGVKKIAMDIGRAMKVSDEELEALDWGGLLHDIGQDRRTGRRVAQAGATHARGAHEDEQAPGVGRGRLSPRSSTWPPELPIILHHHEWFNGSGYPRWTSGDEIPKLARILHVADASRP